MEYFCTHSYSWHLLGPSVPSPTTSRQWQKLSHIIAFESSDIVSITARDKIILCFSTNGTDRPVFGTCWKAEQRQRTLCHRRPLFSLCPAAPARQTDQKKKLWRASKKKQEGGATFSSSSSSSLMRLNRRQTFICRTWKHVWCVATKLNKPRALSWISYFAWSLGAVPPLSHREEVLIVSGFVSIQNVDPNLQVTLWYSNCIFFKTPPGPLLVLKDIKTEVVPHQGKTSRHSEPNVFWTCLPWIG